MIRYQCNKVTPPKPPPPLCATALRVLYKILSLPWRHTPSSSHGN